ncbi:unnamed protein product [Euphydryas editha]|nr:unnamed protein product [Euphydryas editha]
MKSSYDADSETAYVEVEESPEREGRCEPAPECDERDSYLEPVAYDSEPVMVPVIHDSQPAIIPFTCEPRPTATVHMMSDQQPTTVLPIYDPQPTVTQITSEPELTAAPLGFESEPVAFESAPCEPTSEMYYTASSEVSLLSDMDLQERAQSEDSDRERDDRNSVMAGHVAAMRERFESMTRTNTPCPDLIRSASPSFEVFRNVSTSPDVDKS